MKFSYLKEKFLYIILQTPVPSQPENSPPSSTWTPVEDSSLLKYLELQRREGLLEADWPATKNKDFWRKAAAYVSELAKTSHSRTGMIRGLLITLILNFFEINQYQSLLILDLKYQDCKGLYLNENQPKYQNSNILKDLVL